jgi:RNA polymerase sigma factor (sigma-70 family)
LKSQTEVEAWLQEHAPFFFAVARNWFRAKFLDYEYSDVEDVATEAMEKVWLYWQTFKDRPNHPHPWDTWCAVVTRNCCRRYVGRAQYASPLPEYRLAGHQPVEALVITRDRIATALQRMTPRQRAVIIMGFYGYDTQEIASELGLTDAEVRSILSSARKKSVRYEEGLKQPGFAPGTQRYWSRVAREWADG